MSYLNQALAIGFFAAKKAGFNKLDVPLDELNSLKNLYACLVMMPYQSPVRILGQEFYASVRDRLAELEGIDPEELQDLYEKSATGLVWTGAVKK